jgi:hypothetical protein
MSWKERLLDQYGYLFNIDGDYTSVCNFIEALLEQHNAKNIIEITARCKETTEALIKETERNTISKLLTNIEDYIAESGKDFGLENIEVVREFHNISEKYKASKE